MLLYKAAACADVALAPACDAFVGLDLYEVHDAGGYPAVGPAEGPLQWGREVEAFDVGDAHAGLLAGLAAGKSSDGRMILSIGVSCE